MEFEKICPKCGRSNEPSANECIEGECKTSLLMTEVTRKPETTPKKGMGIIPKQSRLELLSPNNQSIIIENGVTIGREGIGNEIFKDQLTISRRHAKFEYFEVENVWKICDEGSKNGTYLNGTKISQNKWEILKEGTKISLSSRFDMTVTLNDE